MNQAWGSQSTLGAYFVAKFRVGDYVLLDGQPQTLNKSTMYEPHLLRSPQIGFIFVEFANTFFHQKISGSSDLGT